MRECKRCLELLTMIRYFIYSNDLRSAKDATYELMTLLNGYDSSC